MKRRVSITLLVALFVAMAVFAGVLLEKRWSSAPYRVIADVEYQSIEPEYRGDLYLPARIGDWKATAVVWMHGNHHDKADACERSVGSDLARAGYICFSINYGDWPERGNAKGWARVTQNIVNAKNAVRFLRVHATEYHVNPAHIALFGGSGGANLAILAGFTGEDIAPRTKAVYPGVSSAVSAIGDFYGFASSSWIAPKLTAKSPAMLIVHGKADPLLNYENSVRLDRLLAEKGVPHELLLLENVGHGFDFTTWKNRPLPVDLRPVVIAFLNKYLGRPAAPLNPKT